MVTAAINSFWCTELLTFWAHKKLQTAKKIKRQFQKIKQLGSRQQNEKQTQKCDNTIKKQDKKYITKQSRESNKNDKIRKAAGGDNILIFFRNDHMPQCTGTFAKNTKRNIKDKTNTD